MQAYIKASTPTVTMMGRCRAEGVLAVLRKAAVLTGAAWGGPHRKPVRVSDLCLSPRHCMTEASWMPDWPRP